MPDQPICYGAPLPPVPNKPFLKITWTRVGSPISGIFAANTWTGYWVHWADGTIPCRRDDSCPYCKLPTQYQAYIPIWDIRKAEYWILQLPDGGARMLAGAIEKHGNLNGVEFLSKRSGTKKNSPVVIEIVGKRRNPSPDTIDMAYSLDRVWGMNEARYCSTGGPEEENFEITPEDVARHRYRPSGPKPEDMREAFLE